MKCKLIFHDWRNARGESMYQTEQGVQSSMGDFHGGSTFDAEIVLTPDQEDDLTTSLKHGAIPIFRLVVE